MKIAVGSDHGGFALKEAVKKHLEAKGIEVEDFGCYSGNVDYAVYGAKGRALRGGQRLITAYFVLLHGHRHFPWPQIK